VASGRSSLAALDTARRSRECARGKFLGADKFARARSRKAQRKRGIEESVSKAVKKMMGMARMPSSSMGVDNSTYYPCPAVAIRFVVETIVGYISLGKGNRRSITNDLQELSHS
jgi:hypothetical protein